MKKFYGETIGLKVLSINDKELVIQAGLSVITFVKTKGGNRPFYHFAFNIPMKEVVHFPRWNAHSIFFIDPAGNLVEYIARHDLKNATGGDFLSNDILYASEIGLVTVVGINAPKKLH